MSRNGKLLIANPGLQDDDPFAKSVIYVYQDNHKYGTSGLVLNKPIEYSVQDLCLDYKIDFPDEKSKLHWGGPISSSAMILLHSDDWQCSNTAPAGNGLSISSDKFMFLKMAQGNEPAYWRMYLGLSNWAVGQLDMELRGQFPYNKTHQWLVADANDDIIFNYDGEEQWQEAIQLCSRQVIDQYI